jgi:hypothetical protein
MVRFLSEAIRHLLATGAVLFRQSQAGCRDRLERQMAAHEALVHTVEGDACVALKLRPR